MAAFAPRSSADDSDLETAKEQAIKAAVARVALSVVQIETSGGADLIGSGPRGPQIRKGAGPTTGLVVSSDGYIISSAFNFANKPSAIFVAVPARKERLVAKLVATDRTRMLTLLKVEASGLPVPPPAPKSQLHVGQTVLALGRTWAGIDNPPSVSLGILSALNRIWGKAVQTDAKVSPVNYGGPLIDLEGRVIGVLVPASPRGQDETAGIEWYDAGIGFAIPLEDINAALARLKKGKDLKRGLLGIVMESEDLYGSPAVVASVAPDSAAQRAGIKRGDQIIEIDGHPVERQAQMMHLLGGKYEEDKISVKVRRGKEEHSYANLILGGAVSAFQHAFLGVLPVRDDPELGEEIRQVFPKSPAEAAGLKPGDRIMKWSTNKDRMLPFSGRDELTGILNRLAAGDTVYLEVVRKEGKKTEKVTVALGNMRGDIPDVLNEPASVKKALAPKKSARAPEPNVTLGPDGKPQKKEFKEAAPPPKPVEKKKAETGLLKRTTPAGDREYWLFVPENYDPNISHSVVIFLHPAGKARDKDRDIEKVIGAWEDYCSDRHVILLCPKAEGDTGWVASEIDFIVQTLQKVAEDYTVDRQRVVAHGLGMGGQFAFYLGFNARDWIRGVIAAGAPMTSQPRESASPGRLAFFLIASVKDPLHEAIGESRTRLEALKFPVIYRETLDAPDHYLDDVALDEVVRWLDSMDRQ